MYILQQEKRSLYFKIFKAVLLQLILACIILIRLFKSLIFNFVYLFFQEADSATLNYFKFFKYLRISVNCNSRQAKSNFF